MKGSEFERRVRKLARRKNVTCQFVADRGKGSHGRLLDPEHATKAEKIQAALAAMGKQMTLEVRDAA